MPRDVTGTAELVDSECLGIGGQPSLEDLNMPKSSAQALDHWLRWQLRCRRGADEVEPTGKAKSN